MLVLNLPFKALMFLTLMRPSLVLFLVLWLKLVKDFLKVRCRLALLPFLISCLIWLDLVASLPLIKERILVIILLLHFLSLMLGSVLVLMLPLLVWLTPDLRIKKSLLKCNWTIRKRLPRCKMRLKKRLLAFSLSFEMDAVGALRLSPLRRGLAIDSTVDIFTFYVPHRHVYGEQWIKFMKDGVNATPLPTVNTTGYIDHAAFLGTINP